MQEANFLNWKIEFEIDQIKIDEQKKSLDDLENSLLNGALKLIPEKKYMVGMVY